MERAIGWVYEVFTSIQGEGLYCGQRQTFVRLAGCNLDCDYCDTLAARDPRPPVCRVQRRPGVGAFDETRNPADAGRVIDFCRALVATDVSVTGGEPLVQDAFAADLLAGLKAAGFRTHLETNGTLPDALENIVEHVDVVAMDVKVTGVDREVHRRFLEVAARTEVFVKAVVGARTTPEEMGEWARMIASVDSAAPLVLQPVTGRDPVPGDHLMLLQEAALAHLGDVRVIPQCHKVLGLL